jgi:hypothetical protein
VTKLLPARGFLFLFIWLAAAVGSYSAATPAKAGKPPTITGPYYAAATCDTAELLSLVGKDGLMQKAPRHAAILIQQRIAACQDIINKYLAALPPAPGAIAQNPSPLPALPTPMPQMTAPAGCTALKPGGTFDEGDPKSYDPLRLYSALTYCTNWIARTIPSPSPAVTPTPRPLAVHTPYPGSSDPWIKTVYILGLAADPPTSAQIALQLANNLRSPGMQSHDPKKDIYSNRLVKYAVVAAPAWTLAQYQQQCFNDPSTSGAIVAVQPGTQSSSFNLLFQVSWSALNIQLMVLDCEPTNTAYVNNAAYITWLSHVRTGVGRRYSFNLATALGLLGGYLALQSSDTVTYTYTKPHPTPAPGGSYESEKMVATNQGAGAAGVTGVAALTPLSALGQGSNVDAQTAGALARVLPKLINDLLWTCNTDKPGYTTFPEPQCQWFIYDSAHKPEP